MNRRLTTVVLGVVAIGGLVGGGATAAQAAPSAAALPKITHVWNIVLENENYASTFATPSADPYL
ncbi:MAG: hypothetical protein ACRDNJ_16370, partial [Solirubrobacteraceae bacterium]